MIALCTSESFLTLLPAPALAVYWNLRTTDKVAKPVPIIKRAVRLGLPVAIVVVPYLIVYVAFRIAYPSAYNGNQTRAFSHIDDVAPLIARAPEVPQAQNEVFNVGADTPYSILELAEEISLAFNKPLKLEHLPARKEVVHAFSDHSKARRIFGTTKPVTLREGIGRMAEWVLSKGSATPIWFDDIEIDKKLPPSWRRGWNIH